MNIKSADANFEILKNMRIEINGIFTDIDNKIKNLNTIHMDLVKTHHDSNYRL